MLQLLKLLLLQFLGNTTGLIAATISAVSDYWVIIILVGPVGLVLCVCVICSGPVVIYLIITKIKSSQIRTRNVIQSSPSYQTSDLAANGRDATLSYPPSPYTQSQFTETSPKHEYVLKGFSNGGNTVCGKEEEKN